MDTDDLDALDARLEGAGPSDLSGIVADARSIIPGLVARHGAGSSEHIRGLKILAGALSRDDQDADAAEVYDTLVELYRASSEADGAEFALRSRAMAAMSRAFASHGSLAPLRAIDECIDVAENEFGPLHGVTFFLLEMRARTRCAVLGEAELPSYDALIARASQLGASSDSYARALSEKATALNNFDHDAEAADLWRQVREIRFGLYGADHELSVDASWHYTRSLGWSGDHAAAVAESETLEAQLAPASPLALDVLLWRARWMRETFSWEESVAAYARAIATATAQGAPATDIYDYRFEQAFVTTEIDTDDAIALLDQLVDDIAEDYPDHPSYAFAPRLELIRARFSALDEEAPDEVEHAQLQTNLRTLVADAADAMRRELSTWVERDSASHNSLEHATEQHYMCAEMLREVIPLGDRGAALAEAAQVIAGIYPDSWSYLRLLESAGDVLESEGHLPEALQQYTLLTASARAQNHFAAEVEGLAGQATVLHAQGAHARAAALWHEADAVIAANPPLRRKRDRIRHGQAMTLSVMGRAGEAALILEELASDDLQNYGNDYAVALIRADRDADAIPILRKLLADLQQRESPTSLSALRARGNIALATCAMGDHAQAAVEWAKLLRLQAKNLSPDHADVLITRHNQALEYSHRAMYAEAVPLLRSVFADRERVLGPDAPSTLASLDRLASALHGLGELAEADQLARAAVFRRSQVLGPTHAQTLSSLDTLERIIGAQGGDRTTARESLSSAASATSEAPGFAELRLGKHYAKTSRHADAIVQFTAAADKLPTDADTARLEALGAMAAAYRTLGNDAQAHENFLRALTVQQSVAPDDHWAVAKLHIGDGVVLANLGRHPEAIASARAGVAAAEQGGPDEERMLGYRVSLGRRLSAGGQHAEALEVHRETAARREAFLGRDHEATVDSYDDVAEELLALGKKRGAAKAYRDNIPRLENAFGSDSPRVRRAKRKQEEAIAVRKKLLTVIPGSVFILGAIGLIIWNEFF